MEAVSCTATDNLTQQYKCTQNSRPGIKSMKKNAYINPEAMDQQVTVQL